MVANEDGAERRYDVDGEMYTREDFDEFYGNEAARMWEAAQGRVEGEGDGEGDGNDGAQAAEEPAPFKFAPQTDVQFSFPKDATAAPPALAAFSPFLGSTDAIIDKKPAPPSFPAKAAGVAPLSFPASSSDGAFSGSSTAAAVETIIAVAKGDDVFVCSKCNTPKPSLVGDHLAGKTSVNSQCGSKKCSMKKRQFVRKSAMTEEQKGSVLAEPARPQAAAPVAEAKPAVSNPFGQTNPFTSNQFAAAASPSGTPASPVASAPNPFASAQSAAPAAAKAKEATTGNPFAAVPSAAPAAAPVAASKDLRGAQPPSPSAASPTARSVSSTDGAFSGSSTAAAVDSGFSFANACKKMADVPTPNMFGFPSMRPTPARNTTQTLHPLQRAIRPRRLRRRR